MQRGEIVLTISPLCSCLLRGYSTGLELFPEFYTFIEHVLYYTDKQ